MGTKDTEVTVRVDVVQGEIRLLDALTRWFRGLPHLVLAGIATVTGVVVAVVLGVVVVITGRRPVALLGVQAWAVRQRVRAFSYFFLLRGDFPALANLGLGDDGRDPATEVTVRVAADSVGPDGFGAPLPRWAPVARLVLGLPYVVVGLPIGLLLDLLYPVLVVVAGVRGRWPSGLGAFLARVEAWVGEVFLYFFLTQDRRPAWTPWSHPPAAPT